MIIILRISITFLLLAIALDGQGAGGGRQGQSSGHLSGVFDHDSREETYDRNNKHRYSDYSDHRNYYNSDTKKNTDDHSGHHWSLAYILLFLLVLTIIGFCLCGCCLIIYIFKKKFTSNHAFTQVATAESDAKQQVPKSTSIDIDTADENASNIFLSGLWSGRYYQYDQWHGPSKFFLSFDPKSFTIDGNGSDDVGRFSIVGKYSTATKEIELTKTYERGTGDQGENLGHSVTIEVTWNVEQQSFIGNWYVNTNSYSDDDRFELKFENPA